ncbi:MAG TPA: glycosyltransferase family 87 protein [Gaiellaceae bacterium]|nr:glycosyltransferase family 87 protein [Gaiellaceae bacterium]HVV56802.1 glycosyltransferase family 87 protein [Gaiellaceae bacterium]
MTAAAEPRRAGLSLSSAGPALAGLVVFLASCPLLFRNGSADGDIPVFHRYGDFIVSGQIPYRDFHTEYPPGAQLIFLIPSLWPDGDYLGVFRVLATLGIVLEIVLVALLVDRLAWPPVQRYAATVFAALGPVMLGAFALRRFDMWPTAIAIAVLLCLVARRPRLAFALLAIGSIVKVFPIILLPVALLAVPRAVRIRALALFVAIGVVVMGPFAIVGHANLYNSIFGQADRHLHLDALGSSVLLVLHTHVRLAFDGGGWSDFGGGSAPVASLQSLLQVLGIVVAASLFWRSRRTNHDLVLAVVTTLTAGAFLGKVLSPQFLLWVAPIVLLARSATAVVCFVGAALTTNLLFPDRYAGLLDLHDGPIWLLFVRNAFLVATLVALFAAQVRASQRPLIPFRWNSQARLM